MNQEESDVMKDSQRELHLEAESLAHLHVSNNDSEESSPVKNANNVQDIDRESLGDFSIMSVEEPISTYPLGSAVYVEFEGEQVILENKNIFQNHKLKFQFIGSMISLFLLGLNDQVIGALIEYVLAEYSINRVEISYFFIAQFVGYISSSVLNNYLMKRFGLYKLFYSSTLLFCFSSIFYILRAPYFILLTGAMLIGWSNGTFDCCLNYFVGSLDYSNELLGLMHAMYGFGCLVTPILSIHLVEHGMVWNHYYYFIFGTAFVNFLFAFFFFQNETSAKFRYISLQERKSHNEETDSADSWESFDEKRDPTMLETITNKYVIFFSIALFTYVGSELSVGIWLNNYMFRIQNCSEQKASYITSSFWLFMTLGRVIMGFYTGRYFEDIEIRAIVIYCILVFTGCFSFWLFQFSVPLQIISICFAAWFVGPLFGTTIIISIKTLPKRYVLYGISLIAGFGGTGAAVIPAMVGYISEHLGGDDTNDADGAGLVYFPGIVSTTFFAAAMLWLCFYLRFKSIFDSKNRLK